MERPLEEALTRTAAPVVLYELNEVPWRVVDWYTRQRPDSNLASVLRGAQTFTSVTRDEGELHPWTTWPTVHRGVYNTEHRIRFINQDRSAADQYPPIWEVLAAAGKKVGVFGSLQSYPPQTDPAFSFYIPDTFAPGPETLPARYSCFQKVNLQQTQVDGGIAKPVKLDASLLGNLVLLLFNGLTPRTALRLGRQLIDEKRNSLYRARRAILQAPVAFDVFRHALARTDPDFCTFFTNHVAGIMHRYWKYAFPEDFQGALESDDDRFHAASLLVALDYADEQIGFLRRYADRRDGYLYIVSSMGQEAIDRGNAWDQIRIEDLDRFVRGAGWTRPFQARMAMHPNFTVELESAQDAADFVRIIEGLLGAHGAPAFYDIDTEGNTVLFSLGCTQEMVHGDALYAPGGSGAVRLPFESLGIELIQPDVGTGYHQPEGIVLRYGKRIAADDARTRIESTGIAPMIMQDLGIEPAPAARGSQRDTLQRAASALTSA